MLSFTSSYMTVLEETKTFLLVIERRVDIRKVKKSDMPGFKKCLEREGWLKMHIKYILPH